MTKTKHIAFLLSFAMGITLFFACKKTPDMPPVTPFNIGNTITISQLRTLFCTNGVQNNNRIKFTKDISLYATVIMDATSGNIYKQVYLRDHTGSISMKQLSAGALFQGDSLRINLNGAALDLASSGSYLQIDSVDVSTSSTNKVIKLAVGKQPAPIPVTILELNKSLTTNSCAMNQSIYDGQLVQLNDVQFSIADTGLYFIPHNMAGPVSTNYSLTDCGAQNNITVYTSSYAYQTFTGKVPGKSGSLIAIASIYNSSTGVPSMQLTLRANSEVNLSQPLCGVDTLTENFVNCYNNANFSTVLPTWYNITQLGYTVWVGTQIPNGSTFVNFPSATTFKSGNPRNVMWLISPAIQAGATKNLNFQWATDFWVANQLDVLVSTDFNGINLGTVNAPVAKPAHWTKITPSFTNMFNTTSAPGTYVFAPASPTPVSLSQFLPSGYTGTFYIGFRYTGNQTDSTSTFAIDNVVIKD
jgi:hypothetical protein